MFRLSVSLTIAIFIVIALDLHNVESVVVDGTRKGPSALEKQSHAGEMIDSFNTKTCGMSDPDPKMSTFVNHAKEGQFPWLVSLQIKRNDSSRAHFCMGSFISDRWILSAAHCFVEKKFKEFLDRGDFSITAGSVNAHGASNANFTVKRIFYHSKFNPSSPIGFDVALIEVNEAAQVRTKYNNTLPFINTVCLPLEGKEFKEGQVVKLAGWGDTESKDPKSKPEHLLTTDLVLTNGEKCAEIFSKIKIKALDQYRSYKDFICADYHGERDACQGDSGAPLLEYADGKAVAVGIVSYGVGCATKGVPGVYTRTSSLMPWIKDVTQNKEKASVLFTVLKPENKKT